MFSQDFHQFVESLTEAKVDYLIVGGYAVGIHGHPRFTGDMDKPKPGKCQTGN